jgi:hypothetical protein
MQGANKLITSALVKFLPNAFKQRQIKQVERLKTISFFSYYNKIKTCGLSVSQLPKR